MTQVADNVTIKVSVAWWLRWYLFGVWTVAIMTGATPDENKITRVCVRAFKLKLVQRA